MAQTPADPAPGPSQRSSLEPADRALIRSLILRSAVALAVIGVLTAVELWMQRTESRALASSSAVMNLSGQQRMLSQRAALLVLDAAHLPTAGARERLRELGEIAARMEETHQFLLRHGPRPQPPTPDLESVNKIYFRPAHRLDQRLRRFVAALREIAAAPPHADLSQLRAGREVVASAADGELLAALDAVVGLFQHHYESTVTRLHRTQAVSGLLTLAVLVLAARLAFWPMLVQLRAHLAAVREGKTRFRQVTETIREVFWLRDLSDGRLVYLSPAYEAIWGRDRQALYDGRVDWLSTVHPEDRAAYRRRFDDPTATEPIDIEYRIVRPDGSQRWILDRGFPILDEAGRPYRLAGIAEDLTDKKRAEELLRERTAELALSFENAPLGIATSDIRGQLIAVNPALCSILGYTEEEILGRRLDELLHGDDLAAGAEILRRAARGERSVFSMGCRLRSKDGEMVRGSLHCSVVFGKNDRPVRIISHFEDRTSQLRAEEEARLHRERLAQVSRLHTMGDMAAGIAHEINQPLTAISTYVQACRRLASAGRVDAPEVMEILDKVSGQAFRAGEVIRRLRSFVQRRTTGADLVSINAVVADAIELARADSRFLDLRIATDLAPSLPEAVVDVVQIQQVVLNLLRNAMEASTEAGSTEPILIQTTLDEGEVRVAVTDRGGGLAAEQRAHLFEPFFTTKPGGLGMGLAISRSIVTSHGGRLGYRPNPRGGSIFHFSLPCLEAESAPAPPPERPAAAVRPL